MKNSISTQGFTLIELMIVVAIIGILAAIAIPQFSAYRVRSFNATAQADLRNIMTAEEGFYAENQYYIDLVPTVGYRANLPSLAGARISLNVCATVASATPIDFTVQTEHQKGDVTFSSSQSGSLSTSTKNAPAYTVGC